MKRRAQLSGLLLIICLVLTACWDQRPLEDMALIAGIGIDPYPESPNLMNFSLVYPLYLPDRRQGEKIELIAADNLGQAITVFERQNARQFAGGKVRVVVFGEDAARQGLEGLIDYAQVPTIDDTALVAVTQRASDLWNVQLPETERIAFQIQGMLRNAHREGNTLRITMGELITEASAFGVDAVVPVLKVLDQWRIQVDGAALFRDMQMVDTVTQDELNLLMALRNRIGEVSIVANVGVSDILCKPVVEISLIAPKPRIKPRLENGQLRVKVDFSARYVLNSYDAIADLTEPDATDALTRALESYLLIEMSRLVTKLQELRVDPLGVGKTLRAQNPKQFDPMQYREQWAQAQVDLSVDLHLTRAGTLNRNHSQRP